MSKMTFLINSKQIFEEHVDEISEKHTGEIIWLDDGFKVNYDNSEIFVTQNVLVVKTENMTMTIEPNKTNLSKIQTPYGIIDLEIAGEYVKWEREPFLLKVRYRLKMEQTQEYINELQLCIVED